MKKLYYLIILTVILGLVLTGCFLSNVGQIPTSEQSGVTYLTKGDSTAYPLYAGQDILVGEVLVWDDGETLCVKYQLNEAALAEGWLLYETHWAVAHDVGDIPQTKKHNPIPGQFLYGGDEPEGVDSWEICIPFDELGIEEPGDLLPIVVCTDELIIAAHAVIEKGCNQIGDVYGIERVSGTVWGVDVVTGATAEIFTNIPPPSNTDVGPNGLAYDGANRRFYYCEYYSSTEAKLYFWDGEEHLAGTLTTGTGTAGIANADFDGGKYYFINGKTDDLFEVSFDANGYISNINSLGDIAENTHGWTFNGDIAVKDGVVYGWGKCEESGHPYEYFTYDIAGDLFTLITPTYQNSLQLAFGLDGTLYGHDYYIGDFYEINTDTAGVTLLFDAGVQFTDCSSGDICEPITETAWGAEEGGGTRFVDKGNWATYFIYTIPE
jgi:hypothetical protein